MVDVYCCCFNKFIVFVVQIIGDKMSDSEQQIEEIEVLSSIFPTEFEEISKSDWADFFQTFPELIAN